MKKVLSLVLALMLVLGTCQVALANNYQQHFTNEATFETVEEAKVNGVAFMEAQMPGRTYISDPALANYPNGTYIYRSANMYHVSSAAYRMNTNIVVFVEEAFADKDAAYAYLENLGLIDIIEEATGSITLVTPANGTAFGTADQYAYFQMQSAVFNLAFSAKNADGVSEYYMENSYYGTLTYRYLIGIDGGATFINNYIAPSLDFVSRVAGILLVGGNVEAIRKVAGIVPVYLANTTDAVIAKYKDANEVNAYTHTAKVDTWYNQQLPVQAVAIANEEVELTAEFIDEVYHTFLVKAMRIPVVKDALYTPNTLYSNYNMNEAPYSLFKRSAIINGVTEDKIYVIEHREDRFADIATPDGQYLDVWYEFLPEEVLNGTAPEHSVPLWLSNHGGGDDPVQFVDEMGLLTLAGVERFALVGAAYQHLYSTTAVMADALAAMTQYMLDTYPSLDPSRVYTTGYSMGGGTTVTVLASHPELFAAGAPQASGGSFIGNEEQVAKLNELGMAYFAMTATYDVVGYKNQTLSAGVQAALNRYSSYFDLPEIVYDFEKYPLSGFEGDIYQYTVLNNEYGNHTWIICNEDGEPRVGLNLTENLKHALYPEYGRLAWDFMKHFSRNQETGLIEYNAVLTK